MKLKINEKALATLSSGIMAGFGAALTFVAVPAIKDCNDPLPAWKRLYKAGSKFAITAIIITTGAGIRCYGKTDDIRYLLMSGVTLSIVPYTLFLMKPTNDALFAIEDSSSRTNKEDESKVRQLISKWNRLQYGRTALGLGAFFINILIVYKKFK